MLRLSVPVALALIVAACSGDGATPVVSTTQPATTSSVTDSPPTTPPQPATTTTTTSPPETTSPTSSPPAIDPVIQIAVTIAAGEVSVLVNGEVVDGRVAVDLGSELRIEVIADVVDEVHAHGYDVTATVDPAEAAILEMSVNIPGVFDIELEDAHLLLLQLEVS
ncbi:MAG: hypothetical protein V3W36_07990 [Acidimicrobiia bacterium]